jgi:hypothetical protein
MTDLSKHLREQAAIFRQEDSLGRGAKELEAAADLIEQQAASIAELSLDLERTREERNRSQIEARREIHKEYRDYIAQLEAQIDAIPGGDTK